MRIVNGEGPANGADAPAVLCHHVAAARGSFGALGGQQIPVTKGGMNPQEIEVRREAITSNAATYLILALNAEISSRYPEEGTANHFRLDADEVAQGRGAFFVAYAVGRPLACGAIRLLDADTAEIKRMYVEPNARGLGLGRRLLDALETEARILGVKKIVLETGPRQPEVIALYSRAGFLEIAAFGEYENSPLSVYMGKKL